MIGNSNGYPPSDSGIIFSTTRQQEEQTLNQTTIARPAGIAAIAWLWIAGGILLLISALLTWAVLSLFGSALPTSIAPGGVPADLELMNTLLSNMGVLVWTQVAIGALSIYAGAQFLKLRPWARTAIEVLTWVSLVYVIVNGVYFLYMWESMVTDLSKQMLMDSDALRITGYVTVFTLTVIFAVPLGFMIKYLRAPVVRQAIAAANRK